MQVVVERARGSSPLEFRADLVFNAGWAGRDQEAVRLHIEELTRLGVPPPAEVPTVFPVARHLLVTDSEIQVAGHQTSAEVEYVLLVGPMGVFVTVGSDHSDRELEVSSVLKAKNACPDVVAAAAWPLDEVADHFDSLRLECDVVRHGQVTPYQRGTAGDLLPPDFWIEWLKRRGLEASAGRTVAFFSGTIPALEALAPGDAYEIRLEDPVLGRVLAHRYRVRVLSVPPG